MNANGPTVDTESVTSSKLRRRGRVPVIFAIVAVVVIAIFLGYIIAPAVSDARSPFPSEKTSLTEYGGGVVWTYNPSDFLGIGPLLAFSNASFGIAYPGEWGVNLVDSMFTYSSAKRNVSQLDFMDYHEFDYTNAMSIRVSGKETEQGIVWATFWILVNDPDANGQWSMGDSMAVFFGLVLNGTLLEMGFVHDTEFAIALEFQPEHPSAFKTTEYRFAFHKDKFYSWSPQRYLEWY